MKGRERVIVSQTDTLKSNVEETGERQDEAHMGFSERVNSSLTELKRTEKERDRMSGRQREREERERERTKVMKYVIVNKILFYIQPSSKQSTTKY